MDKAKMTIWDRFFSLNVIFECYGEQEPSVGQKIRLDAFTADNSAINNALPVLKQFCLEDEKMNGSNEITNVFKYVSPKSIYVKRNDNQDIVALLCDYKFDIEHGIAIVFEKGEFKEIVRQGDI